MRTYTATVSWDFHRWIWRDLEGCRAKLPTKYHLFSIGLNDFLHMRLCICAS